jgi:transposase-like protein
VPARRRRRPSSLPRSAFAGFRFPPDVIVLAVRWYLRFGLSCRDVEELLAERGIEVDHVTVYRWVQRFAPLLAEAARPCRHTVGDRWFVDETYAKIAGRWRYLHRAVDQFGQIIDIYLSARRDTEAAGRFFDHAIGTTKVTPIEVITDRAAAYARVLDELVPAAWHHTDRYANNRVEADHGQPKRRLRPMRGLKTDAGARAVTRGTRLRAEPPPRPLRTRRRRTHPAAPGRRLRRTSYGHLTSVAKRRGSRQHAVTDGNATPPKIVCSPHNCGSSSGDRPAPRTATPRDHETLPGAACRHPQYTKSWAWRNRSRLVRPTARVRSTAHAVDPAVSATRLCWPSGRPGY